MQCARRMWWLRASSTLLARCRADGCGRWRGRSAIVLMAQNTMPPQTLSIANDHRQRASCLTPPSRQRQLPPARSPTSCEYRAPRMLLTPMTTALYTTSSVFLTKLQPCSLLTSEPGMFFCPFCPWRMTTHALPAWILAMLRTPLFGPSLPAYGHKPSRPTCSLSLSPSKPQPSDFSAPV